MKREYDEGRRKADGKQTKLKWNRAEARQQEYAPLQRCTGTVNEKGAECMGL